MNYDLVVLGSGPGGYTAAFRAADLGLKVALVEKHPKLGGVCLNVGCIPSKTLLHVAKVISDVRDIADYGVYYEEKNLDLDKLNSKKDSVISLLSKGLGALAKKRQVDVVTGVGFFTGTDQLTVKSMGGSTQLNFEKAIIATGSLPTKLAGTADDPRIMDSTGALSLKDIPERLLIVGGGIIGLEMASVYAELGSRVTIVEIAPNLMAGTDIDLVAPLEKSIIKRVESIYKEVRVVGVEPNPDSLVVTFDGQGAPAKAAFDKILMAIGRVPNTDSIGLETLGVNLSENGFISVDNCLKTSMPNIYAIGDVLGEPMLAHKASRQGKVAAESAVGLKSVFEPRSIPSVAYTDPELAWVGLTEDQALRADLEFKKGVFPWGASGRSLSMGRQEGITKLLFEKNGGRLIGGGIVGANAGELIGEIALALEMGSDFEDLGLTIHPHPTLVETIGLAAEVASGTITDLYLGGKK